MEMLMPRPFLAALGCMLLLGGCRATAADMTADEKAAVAEAVEARVTGYIDAISRRDLDAMLDFWADTDGFVMAGDGQLTVGYAAWAEALRANATDRVTVNSIAKSNEHVYVLAPDAAAYSMAFEWSMTQAAGDTLRSRGAWTYVFKRLDGAWRVVHSGGTHVYY